MDFPVTTAGSLRCAHSGGATVRGDSKLTVEGKPVVAFTAATTIGPYEGCIFSSPCVATAALVPNPGRAVRLTVRGDAVLLAGLNATSTPAGAPVLVSAGQTKLTAS